MHAQFLGHLPLADAGLKVRANLVSLALGQLSVSHALLHFGEPRRVPALALLPLPRGPKCCGYPMNPGAEVIFLMPDEG